MCSYTPRSFLENRTRFQTHMGKVYTHFQSDTAQKPPAKTLPFGAAHTYMAYIREYPSQGGGEGGLEWVSL